MANKRNKKHEKRVRKLVAMVILCAIVLVVSTYAWFIGMKTVNLDKFDINIKTTEGLYLSMDGKSWTYNLEGIKTAESYAKNTNTFADKGLIPMSTVGDMDKEASRMKLYEKGSLTSTPGGMRLLASQVKNGKDDGKEGEGYVAFDLFIKNLSGTEYYAENNPLNEEAIYLTTNSKVKVLTTGEGQENADKTGIENSVRIGFAQIGRMTAATDTDDEDERAKVTGITCSDDTTNGVTGICRNAQIWEPNDTKHVQNALNWYKTSCLQRKAEGTEVTSKDSYGEACADLELTNAYPTYAISREIAIEDKVNIYDGLSYNTYTKNSTDYDTYIGAEDKNAYKLVEFPYFTDTMKMKTSVDRPQFMTLAPNSITKVRVYIWIEGQDIDNYDFASLGKQIAINFGFTKERYTEGDVNYEGPSTDITNEGQQTEPEVTP